LESEAPGAALNPSGWRTKVIKKVKDTRKNDRGNAVALSYNRRKSEILQEVKKEFGKRKKQRLRVASRGLITLRIRREAERRLEKEFPKAMKYPGKKLSGPETAGGGADR